MSTNNKMVLDRIISLVKSQCEVCGVTFREPRKASQHGGGFTESERLLEVNSRTIINNGTISKLKLWERGTVALHEMVHMWQWHRRDLTWNIKYRDTDTNYSDIILEYANGEAWYPQNDLIQSAKYLMKLEWEAEQVAAQMARSMGLDFPYARYLKGAQLYVYGYYVLAISGLVPGYKTQAIIRRHIRTTDRFELTEGLADKMIRVTREHMDNCETIWQGKTCVKRPE